VLGPLRYLELVKMTKTFLITNGDRRKSRPLVVIRQSECLSVPSSGTGTMCVCMCVMLALDPFPTVVDPDVHRPAVGSSLTLKCDPPHSYPPGTVYWGETKNGPKLRPIENNDRVSLDYEGTSPLIDRQAVAAVVHSP